MKGTGKLFIATVAALALAGCTGGSTITTETPTAGATEASPGVSATASPTPSATGPLTDEQLLEILPEEATYQDSAGAIATAKFFLEEYQRVYETGDLRVWNALARPDCEFCAGVATNVDELHSAGGHREGGFFTFDFSDVQVGRNADNGYFYVGFDASWTTTEDHFEDGTVLLDAEGTSGRIVVEMLENGDYWQVRDLGVEVG